MALPESPIMDDQIEGEFCCRGCLETYRLVTGE